MATAPIFHRPRVKIAVLICGQFRFMDFVYKNVETMMETFTDDVDFYVSIDHDEVDVENSSENGSSQYKHVYHHDYNLFKKCPRLRQVVFNKTIYSNVFRNVLNYSHKLIKGLGILTDQYDVYVVLRSDLILHEPLPLDRIIKERGTSFLNYSHNPYIISNEHKINGNLIITTSFKFIQDLKSFLYHFLGRQTPPITPNGLCPPSRETSPLGIKPASTDTKGRNAAADLYKLDYFDVVLYRFLQRHQHTYQKINVKTHLMLSLCNILAISGDSGSGKSTLMEALYRLLYDEDVKEDSSDMGGDVIKLETDRYHKWERGDDMYRSYTHLNPEANYLQKMEDDVYNLKIGEFICAVDYDHSSGRFTQKQIIHPKSHVLLCGLHTLWSPSLLEMIDVKIYMDTSTSLIRKWKIIRDVKQRGKSIAQVDHEILKRKNDFMNFIDVQKKDADVVVRFYEQEETTNPPSEQIPPTDNLPVIGTVRCKCMLRQRKGKHVTSLLTYVGYEQQDDDSGDTWIELKGDPTELASFLREHEFISPFVINRLQSDYYGELQLLIFILSKCQGGPCPFEMT